MKLVHNWADILKRAWSVKFNVLAALFSAAEVAVSFYQPAWIPAGIFAGFAAVVSIGGNVSRVLAQKELHND